MRTNRQIRCQRRLRPLAAFLFGLSLAGSALGGEGDPLTLTLGQSFAHDDNIFRLSDGQDTVTAIGRSERSDTISRTFALLTFDQTVSRQRFAVNLGLNHNRYQRFSFLNYSGYGLGATWYWVVGNRWLGQVQYERARELQGFGDFKLPIRVLYINQKANANAEYRFDPDWSALIGVGRVNLDYSDSLLAGGEYRNNIVEVGVVNRRPGGNELGIKLRRIDSRYPTRGILGTREIDNSFTQDNLLVTALWHITGSSVLRGFVGYAKQRYDDVTERDFSSPVARLEYDWTITPILVLNATIRRELQAVQDVVPSSTVTKAVSFGPTWRVTPKISLEGKVEYGRRDFRGDINVAVLGATPRQDTVKNLELKGTYKPIRNVQLSLSAIHERRDSNTSNFDYTDNIVLAAAQISF